MSDLGSPPASGALDVRTGLSTPVSSEGRPREGLSSETGRHGFGPSVEIDRGERREGDNVVPPGKNSGRTQD